MQCKNKKQKPTKDTFIKYYILWPIENIVESIADFFRWVWRKLTGAWWCDHCETYHGRRVHKFTYYDAVCNTHLERHMCSLGREAMLKHETPTIAQAAERLAAAAKQAVQEVRAISRGMYDEPPNIFPTPDRPCPGYNDEDLAN